MVNLNKPQKHYYVAIVGPLGSGKTTLLENLYNRFDGLFRTYKIYNKDHETIEINKQKDHAYIQQRILDNDGRRIVECFKQNTNGDLHALFIADSSYHEHYIYNLTFHALKKFSYNDCKHLHFKHATIRDTLPNPDMYIYVDYPVQTIIDNIKNRNRKFETQMSDYDLAMYIRTLKVRYESVFLSNRNYRYDKKLLKNVVRYTGEHNELLRIEAEITKEMSERSADEANKMIRKENWAHEFEFAGGLHSASSFFSDSDISKSKGFYKCRG